MLAPKDLELDFAFADFVSIDFSLIGLMSVATVYNFTTTLVEMLDEFKQRLLEGYQQDLDYVCITDVLKSNDKIKDPLQVDQGQLIDSNKAALPFTRDEDRLIWHTRSGTPCLCIP